MAAKWKGPKPEKFAFVIEQRMNALLSQAVLQTDTLLKQESPVDKGRFQNSWQIGEDAIGEYDGGEGLGETPPRGMNYTCLLYTSPSPRDGLLSRMPSSA